MVGGMLRHMKSLRSMRRDNGWIHTLLEEAENERMHLLTFLQLRQPGFVFRGLVLLSQVCLFFFSYRSSSSHVVRLLLMLLLLIFRGLVLLSQFSAYNLLLSYPPSSSSLSVVFCLCFKNDLKLIGIEKSSFLSSTISSCCLSPCCLSACLSSPAFLHLLISVLFSAFLPGICCLVCSVAPFKTTDVFCMTYFAYVLC